jgi:hypothetical protein
MIGLVEALRELGSGEESEHQKRERETGSGRSGTGRIS